MNTNAEYAQDRGPQGWSGRGTLTELVKELERQKASKVDFVADTRALEVRPSKDGRLILAPKADDARMAEWLGRAGAPLRESALVQLGQKQEPEIPTSFMKNLAAMRPTRAAELLNGLMQDGPARRFVRCLDGQVRAVLSDRYRVLDHYDIAFAALDAVRAQKGEIVEASLSETNMRIKFTTRAVWQALDVKRQGDKGSWYAGGLGSQEYLSKVAAKAGGELPGGPGTVHPLVTLSNSETGHGGLGVRIGILQAICFNLATVEEVIGQVHLGERLPVGVFSDATLSAEAKAIYMKARDSVVSAFKPDVFARMVDLCRLAQERAIIAPSAAVDHVVKAAGLSDASKDAVLAYFLRDYDANQYGLAQAIARHAQDTKDAEAGAELEIVAGRVLRGELVKVGS